MLLVVVPVIIMTLAFAWKYRASNKAPPTPRLVALDQDRGAVWIIPILIIIALGYVTYHSTHKLDPYRPLDSDVKPVQIDVVALDWKWLFIYPEQGIATVNKIVFPANTRSTSASPPTP
jgi:cytochrome o ubiquinol oxidase subunit 2